MSGRLRTVVVAACAAAWCLGWPPAVHAAEWKNCEDFGKPDLAPIGSGPLELTHVYCQRKQSDFVQVAMVSPDGRAIAYLQGGSTFVAERKVLHVSRLDAYNDWTSHALSMGALWQFGQADRSIPAYRWSSDSSGIWTGTREPIGPEGIARSGLQPAFVSLQDGRVELFAIPRHPAGPLDGLLWADGEGLALAYFGARGPSYLASQQPQPPRIDRNPAFAMIDAKRGVVLDTFPFDAVPDLKNAHNIANVHNAAATRLPDGKVRAVVSAHAHWAVWTQGQPPLMVRNPYAPDPPIPTHDIFNKLSISPDGSRLLVTRTVCDGGYEYPRQKDGVAQRAPPAPRCKPVDGVVAALHDLSTGRALWTVRATVHLPTPSINPAISDDGRYALIGLPHASPYSQIALVSMDDGRIVQTVRSPGYSFLNSIGFLQGGRGVWIHGNGMTALYALRAGAP